MNKKICCLHLDHVEMPAYSLHAEAKYQNDLLQHESFIVCFTYNSPSDYAHPLIKILFSKLLFPALLQLSFILLPSLQIEGKCLPYLKLYFEKQGNLCWCSILKALYSWCKIVVIKQGIAWPWLLLFPSADKRNKQVTQEHSAYQKNLCWTCRPVVYLISPIMFF